MTAGTQSSLKLVQLNAENLFIFMDKFEGQDLSKISEEEWQNLSIGSVNNKPLHKIQWLADSLRQLDPDIVFMSEVGGEESLKNFAKHFLNSDYTAHIIEGNSDRGIDVGYLVHQRLNKKFLLLTHKNRSIKFNYPHEEIWNEKVQDTEPHKRYPSHRFSRDLLELRMFDPNTSKLEMIFFACHLKSKLDPEGIDPEGKQRRKAEFETVLKIYSEVLKETESKVPVVIAGDFNGQARKTDPDPEFQSIKKTDLCDPFDLLNLPYDERSSRYEIRTGQPPKGQQIDYILLSKHFHKAIIPHKFGVFKYLSELGTPLPPIQTLQQKWSLPSDHYPTFVTIDLEKLV